MQHYQPIDAFAWLLDQFRHYTRNELTWRDVQQVLSEADTFLEHYHFHRKIVLQRYSTELADGDE